MDVNELYLDRARDAAIYLEGGGSPAHYWDRYRSALVFHVVGLNDQDVIATLECRIKHRGFQEWLVFGADRAGEIRLKRQNETELREIRDSGILSIMASTYEGLSRELRDPEWTLRVKTPKQKKQVRRVNQN